MQCTGYSANTRGGVLVLLLAKWEEPAKSMAEMAAWASVTMRWLSSMYRGEVGREVAKLGL